VKYDRDVAVFWRNLLSRRQRQQVSPRLHHSIMLHKTVVIILVTVRTSVLRKCMNG
jgi:hypothetical protein